MILYNGEKKLDMTGDRKEYAAIVLGGARFSVFQNVFVFFQAD